MEVTFYVLDAASSTGRLRLACRITEKAYRAGERVVIWHTDATEIATLDELLWTFGDDRSFIPHERFLPGAAPQAPVLLVTGTIAAGTIAAATTVAGMTAPSDLGVLLNLAAEVPEAASRAARVIEIIDGDRERRAAGRARFKAYRDLGWPVATHNVQG